MPLLNKSDIPRELQDPLLHAPGWIYIPCLGLRLGLGLVLLLSQNHIAHRVILVVLVLVWIGFLIKLVRLGFHVWKNYARFLIIAGIAILLIGLSWNRHQDWLIKPAGLLVILDAALGWQSRFLTSNFEYVLTKRGIV
jgi:hypothetical protein